MGARESKPAAIPHGSRDRYPVSNPGAGIGRAIVSFVEIHQRLGLVVLPRNYRLYESRQSRHARTCIHALIREGAGAGRAERVNQRLPRRPCDS